MAAIDTTTHAPATSPIRWTRLNISLHWTIVGLLIAQFIDSEWMNPLFDASLDGTAVSASTTLLGYAHMTGGGLILLAIAVRLWDRVAHGRPVPSDDEPNWAKGLARSTHSILYALLFAMPVAGALAWFTGSETIATAHGWAWTALMVAAGLHVTGALTNHFWYGNDVLRRMMPGQGRTS